MTMTLTCTRYVFCSGIFLGSRESALNRSNKVPTLWGLQSSGETDKKATQYINRKITLESDTCYRMLRPGAVPEGDKRGVQEAH